MTVVAAMYFAASKAWSQVELFDFAVPNDLGTTQLVHDAAYGSDPAQRLDVFAPRGADGPLPIVVFIHGGSWSTGTKDGYGFAGAAFASKGYVTVVPGYRLHPNGKYPAFIEDCAAAVAWARNNAAEIGGDPDRIVLAGHSAGAYNAAVLAYDQRWLDAAGVPRSAIRGFVGLAGPYDFLPLKDRATIRTFTHVQDLQATQPINFVDSSDPPAILIHGSSDKIVHPTLHSDSLSRELMQAGVGVDVLHYPGIGHAGLLTTLALPLRWRANTLDDAAAFIARHVAR
ncbi:alpha/beta hydrolase [Tepidamorphus sp. 3E244]|uniref:alpha/beta hydrolase n=1 Tax=Tepidamorphus sp. 3E244 TaxID=3385498 RepID=UPI0038FBE7B4